MYSHPTVLFEKTMEMGMRTSDHQRLKMFFYVSTDNRIAKHHPLRAVKAMARPRQTGGGRPA
jgi:hypothetical protein